MNSDDQLAALLAGQLDIGVLYRQSPFPSDFNSRSLSSYKTKLLVNSNDPLAKKSRVRLADLRNRDMALVSRTVAPTTYGDVLASCARGGLAPHIAFEVNSDEALVNLVAEGLAIGFVGPSPRNQKIIPGTTVLTVEGFDLEVHLVVLWNTDRETPAVLEFVNQLVDHTTELDSAVPRRPARRKRPIMRADFR
jgi:DNA-binding transcriptional LysR family regulator